MDGARVWVVLVDDDGEMDAQIFQTEGDAERYVVGLVKEVIAEQEIDDFEEDGGTTGSWSLWIGDIYERAIDFLNFNDVQDFGVLTVERHIHRKGEK